MGVWGSCGRWGLFEFGLVWLSLSGWVVIMPVTCVLRLRLTIYKKTMTIVPMIPPRKLLITSWPASLRARGIMVCSVKPVLSFNPLNVSIVLTPVCLQTNLGRR